VPLAGLVAGPQGTLYGTTYDGGSSNEGTVFELAPNGRGAWNKTVLHSFKTGTDGSFPKAGLIFDSAGNLYGTTSLGGASGVGVVFELSRNGYGGWNETVLHAFDGTDGFGPRGSLLFDSAGNLYGTTEENGSAPGTVFELAPDGHGGWKETVLHSFNGNDGAVPDSGVIFDSAGNLYGTTSLGGASGAGVVFELAPDGHGGWDETVLHSFSGQDGEEPVGGLIFDASGNLYGTTSFGGANNCGVVFELAPNSHGGWKETVLHSFNGQDGEEPLGGLIFDAVGNLYGTTDVGGASNYGTVFKLAPKSQGGWAEGVLHSFLDRPGASPHGSLIFGSLGRLYGTTAGLGERTFGSVFEIAP
jgi:uncharacterized repeat protein (TIGR03803 family)